LLLFSLASFNALAIEWLIVLRCSADCIGLTVLTADVLLMPVALYTYMLNSFQAIMVFVGIFYK
jgi:hypothetical protein